MYFGDYQQGSSGAAVKEIQQNLETLGYSVGDSGVDGIFGPDTAAAVRSFQQDHSLVADGIVGPQTTAAIAAALTSSSGTNGTTSSATPEFGPANPLVGPPAAGTGSSLPGGPTQTPAAPSTGSIMDFFKSPIGLGALAVGGLMLIDSKGASGSSRRGSRSRRSSRSSRSRSRSSSRSRRRRR